VKLKTIRIASVAALAALFFLPSAAAAAPSPSPSPSLDSILVAPSGAGYVQDYQAFPGVQGSFEAVDLLVFMGPAKPSQTYRSMQEEGFIAGYGRAWFDRSANHLLVELVVAFTGGQGAMKWLPEARSINESYPDASGDFSVSGIDASYGVKYVNTSSAYYSNAAGFVKGNDFFIVDLISGKNDLGDAASTQAKKQYDAAPAGTIPTSQWPENAPSATPSAANRPNPVGSLPVELLVIVGVAGVLLVAVAVVGVLLVRRAGRPSVATASVAPAPTQAALQLSADGTHWWDGQAWKDASLEPPPVEVAQRSADGYYWWDGQRWREMPRAS